MEPFLQFLDQTKHQAPWVNSPSFNAGRRLCGHLPYNCTCHVL